MLQFPAIVKLVAVHRYENVAVGASIETEVALGDLIALGMDASVWREGKEHFMRCRMGEPDAPIAVVGTADQPNGNRRRGTEITFLPSSKIFTKTEFDFATIEHRLRGLAGFEDTGSL